jgi:hypothetical protein
MALTKVNLPADLKRGGGEYKQESSRDGGYSKVSDSKMYSRKSGEYTSDEAAGGSDSFSTTNKMYSRPAGEYAQESAKTDGMCK